MQHPALRVSLRSFTRELAFVLVAACAWACNAAEPAGGGAGGGTLDGDPAPASACAPAGAPDGEDSANLDEHACLHVGNGPFETLDAETGAGIPTVELRNTHVAYTIRLVDGRGAVRLSPRSTATYALFQDAGDVPLRVLDEQGAEACSPYERPVQGCAGFRSVAYFALERKARYRVELGPTARSEVVIVMEQTP